MKIPKSVQHLLKFGLGAAAIWALIHTGALRPKLIAHAFVAHPWLCGFGFLAYLFPVLIAAWMRWFLLMRSAGLQITAWRCLSLHMIGIFFNTLIPGGNGGDFIKGFYLFKDYEADEKSLALTSIAMDRLVGTYGLLCMAMIMTGFNFNLWIGSTVLRVNSFFYAGVFLLTTIIIGVFLSPISARLLASPKLGKMPGGKFFTSLANSLQAYRRKPWDLLVVLSVGFVVDCGLILMYFFFANALDLKIPLFVHGYVVPTMTMINGLPISPSGVGVGEAAGEVVYRNVGVLTGGSEILALVHICILVTSLLGAPFYFLYKPRKVD